MGKPLFEPALKPATPNSDLSEDRLPVYNEFAVFNEYHAFFCNAFAGVVSADELLDTSTLHGINRCSRWMKQRMEEFKARLEAIERKSRTAAHWLSAICLCSLVQGQSIETGVGYRLLFI